MSLSFDAAFGCVGMVGKVKVCIFTQFSKLRIQQQVAAALGPGFLVGLEPSDTLNIASLAASPSSSRYLHWRFFGPATVKLLPPPSP